MASTATPEAKKAVEFLNKYAKLNKAIELLQTAINNGAISVQQANALIKQNLQTAETLKKELDNYISRNKIALRQQGILGQFETLLDNVEDRQIPNLENLERQVRIKGIGPRKYTEAELQATLKELNNKLKALKAQSKCASELCMTNQKGALEAFAKLNDPGNPSLLNDIALLKERARSSGITSMVSAAEALNISATQSLVDIAKASQACKNKQPVNISVNQDVESISNDFQSLQVQVETATTNCAIDKPAALAAFQAVLDKYAELINKVSELKNRCDTNKTKDQSLEALSKSLMAGLEAAKNAYQECGQFGNSTAGLQGDKDRARAEATKQDAINAKLKSDWRVRLALAPGADGYLYRVPPEEAGILAPLQETEGVIFPYTPDIQVTYTAKYDTAIPTHSNYMVLQYQNSSVENVNISCDFTAQDNREAAYLLAVIHFFRSATKMFYGQDENPKPGTPPPLCFLYGLGAFQFDSHPLVITSFQYQLPTDVDYIRATPSPTTAPGANKGPARFATNTRDVSDARLQSNDQKLSRNGNPSPPNFSQVPGGTVEPTYVPTKIRLQIGCLPVVSRNMVSRNFSLRDYATGKLLQGSKSRTGGFW